MTPLDPINEGCHGKYQGTLVDDAGQPVPGGQITEVRVTYWHLDGSAAGTIINEREDDLVYGTASSEEVTIDEDGVLIWQLTPLDTIVGDDRKQIQTNRVEFRWVDSLDQVGKHVADIPIRNLRVDA